MRICSISLAIFLSLCAASAEAGTVTWEFVESSGSGAGTIGASMTLNSPPVELTPGVSWTATTADLVDFRILDPNIGPVGPYDTNLNVASILEGVGPNFVNIHEISGQNASNDIAFSNINGELHESDLGIGLAGGGSADINGDWVVMPSSVPEPSSLALAGIAAMTGSGAWILRRRTRR
jgi:PEP-CTERM motif